MFTSHRSTKPTLPGASRVPTLVTEVKAPKRSTRRDPGPRLAPRWRCPGARWSGNLRKRRKGPFTSPPATAVPATVAVTPLAEARGPTGLPVEQPPPREPGRGLPAVGRLAESRARGRWGSLLCFPGAPRPTEESSPSPLHGRLVRAPLSPLRARTPVSRRATQTSSCGQCEVPVLHPFGQILWRLSSSTRSIKGSVLVSDREVETHLPGKP